MRLGPLLLIALTACSMSTTVSSAPATTVTVASTSAPAGNTSTTVVTTTTTTIPPTTTTTLAALQGLELELVVEGLIQPVLLISPPGDRRRFVAERTGVVWLLDEQGVPADEPFLDLRDRVNSGGIEQGFLGMAFHPRFADNGRFFAYYYKQGIEQTQLSEFRVSQDPNVGDPSSEIPLLTFDKPTTRHNGGMLQFGPDHYLWMSLGEGGAASVNSQDPNRLLSSILRLDIDSAEPYGIPDDNPFANGGGAPEVWAKGLRNPWRFSIDRDLIYIGDVGHEDFEEIDVVPLDGAPYNFGWLRMEGTSCFQRGCDAVAEGLTLPVLEYTHDEGCAVTGGFVYRGQAIPELDGQYFYGDWCGQWIRSFRYEGGEVLEQQTRFEDVGQINSFGIDSDGELYVLTYEGAVKKIVPVR